MQDKKKNQLLSIKMVEYESDKNVQDCFMLDDNIIRALSYMVDSILCFKGYYLPWTTANQEDHFASIYIKTKYDVETAWLSYVQVLIFLKNFVY